LRIVDRAAIAKTQSLSLSWPCLVDPYCELKYRVIILS
jgi:hypothetical protein